MKSANTLPVMSSVLVGSFLSYYGGGEKNRDFHNWDVLYSLFLGALSFITISN